MLRTETRGPITRIRLARTLLGRPIYEVSAFLVADTLIDAGCPGTARELLAFVKAAPVRQVVVTHYHEDHSGGAALLARELGVSVLAPADTVPRIADFYRLPPYRRLSWGQPENVAATPIGDEVRAGPLRLRAVPTPGHSPDHVCLFDPERRLVFAGDLFISPRARYLRRGENAREILASLHAIRALEPALLLCAHAGFVTDPGRALDAKIAHWEALADRAAELARTGLDSASITRRLLGREGFLTLLSLGDFSKRNLIASLLRDRPPAS